MPRRARRAVGRRVWLQAVALEVLEAYHRPPLDRPRELSAYVEIVLDELSPRRQPLFHPETVRAPWPLPRIDTVGDLAEFLLLKVRELEWFATCAASSAWWPTISCSPATAICARHRR
jgi:RNA-directed DNA polymerase